MTTLLLTIDELAVELRCGKTKAAELVKTGAVPSIKVGRLRRVRWADLVECLSAIEPSLPGEDEAA